MKHLNLPSIPENLAAWFGIASILVTGGFAAYQFRKTRRWQIKDEKRTIEKSILNSYADIIREHTARADKGMDEFDKIQFQLSELQKRMNKMEEQKFGLQGRVDAILNVSQKDTSDIETDDIDNRSLEVAFIKEFSNITQEIVAIQGNISIHNQKLKRIGQTIANEFEEMMGKLRLVDFRLLGNSSEIERYMIDLDNEYSKIQRNVHPKNYLLHMGDFFQLLEGFRNTVYKQYHKL